VTRQPSDPEVQSQRRSTGGARREASDRITLRAGDFATTGWALNRSRGGLRLIVEDALQPGMEYEVTIGDEPPAASRLARVIWVQNEADGQVVGLQFVGGHGSVPPM
jgi:hypothetical protein